MTDKSYNWQYSELKDRLPTPLIKMQQRRRCEYESKANPEYNTEWYSLYQRNSNEASSNQRHQQATDRPFQNGPNRHKVWNTGTNHYERGSTTVSAPCATTYLKPLIPGQWIKQPSRGPFDKTRKTNMRKCDTLRTPPSKFHGGSWKDDSHRPVSHKPAMDAHRESPACPEVIDNRCCKGVTVDSGRFQRLAKVNSDRIQRPAEVDRCDHRNDAHSRGQHRAFKSSAGTYEKSLDQNSVKNTPVLGSCATNYQKHKKRAWKYDKQPTDGEVAHASASSDDDDDDDKNVSSTRATADNDDNHCHASKRRREEDTASTAKRSQLACDEPTETHKRSIKSIETITQPVPAPDVEEKASTAKRSSSFRRVQVRTHKRTNESVMKAPEPQSEPEEEEEEEEEEEDDEVEEGEILSPATRTQPKHDEAAETRKRKIEPSVPTPEPRPGSDEEEERASPAKRSQSCRRVLIRTHKNTNKSAVKAPEPRPAPKEEEERASTAKRSPAYRHVRFETHKRTNESTVKATKPCSVSENEEDEVEEGEILSPATRTQPKHDEAAGTRKRKIEPSVPTPEPRPGSDEEEERASPAKRSQSCRRVLIRTHKNTNESAVKAPEPRPAPKEEEERASTAKRSPAYRHVRFETHKRTNESTVKATKPCSVSENEEDEVEEGEILSPATRTQPKHDEAAGTRKRKIEPSVPTPEPRPGSDEEEERASPAKRSQSCRQPRPGSDEVEERASPAKRSQSCRQPRPGSDEVEERASPAKRFQSCHRVPIITHKKTNESAVKAPEPRPAPKEEAERVSPKRSRSQPTETHKAALEPQRTHAEEEEIASAVTRTQPAKDSLAAIEKAVHDLECMLANQSASPVNISADDDLENKKMAEEEDEEEKEEDIVSDVTRTRSAAHEAETHEAVHVLERTLENESKQSASPVNTSADDELENKKMADEEEEKEEEEEIVSDVTRTRSAAHEAETHEAVRELQLTILDKEEEEEIVSVETQNVGHDSVYGPEIGTASAVTGYQCDTSADSAIDDTTNAPRAPLNPNTYYDTESSSSDLSFSAALKLSPILRSSLEALTQADETNIPLVYHHDLERDCTSVMSPQSQPHQQQLLSPQKQLTPTQQHPKPSQLPVFAQLQQLSPAVLRQSQRFNVHNVTQDPQPVISSHSQLMPPRPQSETVTYHEHTPDYGRRMLDSSHITSTPSLLAIVKEAIRCSACSNIFNRAVICHDYLIQLNRPIQCSCGCVMCTLCYQNQKGCHVHNMLSSRAPVNVTANNLASCPDLKNVGEWDLLLNADDPFKVNGNMYVQQIINGMQSPGFQELQSAFNQLLNEHDSMSFRYWKNETMPEEGAYRYVCIPHLPGFWDHILVGTRARPKTEAMFAQDVYLPRLFDVALGPYRFHWCCFVLTKQIILAMWCTNVTKRGLVKVCTLADNTLKNYTTSVDFRKMVFYLCRWFEAQYASQSDRPLKVVLDCKPSEGSTLVHFMTMLASKCGMEEITLQLQQNRGGRDDMNYTVNIRHAISILSCPYNNMTMSNVINIYHEFASYYENDTNVGLGNIRTNTEFFSYV